MGRLVLLATLALVAAACAADSSITDQNGSWQLHSGTIDGRAVPIVNSHPITLNIDGKVIGGTASCNGYGGEVQRDGGFRVTSLNYTQMACFPEATMLAESTYLEALGRVDTANVIARTLVLTGSGVSLEFAPLDPVPTADLVGTTWLLDGLLAGDTVTSVGGDRATLQLLDDGTFTGSTGCRSVAGSYVVSGAEVIFTSWGAEGECPQSLQAQDSHVVSVFEGGFRVEIEGGRLTILVRGNEGLTYRAGS